VHLVRSLLDEIFGPENFVALITTQKTTSSTGTGLAAVVDFVVWYARKRESLKYRELFKAKEYGGLGASGYTKVRLPDGSTRSLSTAERANIALLPAGARLYAADNLTSQSIGREKGEGAASWFKVQIGDASFDPGPKARWKTNAAGMNRLLAAGRAEPSGNRLTYVRYLDDFPAYPYTNIWTDTVSSFMADKIYVVQTNVKVIERCILMSTDPGDLVLDPTCGSGTTAFVAELWGRRWITVDTSRVALALARQRIIGAKYPYFVLADSDEGRRANELSPAATTKDLSHGFVYKRVQHITLRSIANNPDIEAGMAREQVEAAIKRHADFELLYDQPVEDKSRVRVAGPFTVESLSPHRSVSFDQSTEFRAEADERDGRWFEQTILSNLRAAGVQNGRRNERLVFESVDPHPGAFIQAVGTQAESGAQVAISIGPQYGTVSAGFIKQAAREAVEGGVPILAVLGFAFDPNLGVESDEEGFAVVAGVRDLGKVKVLVVRMNIDLLMGEELKKTASGNLFTVFGEPDLALRAVGEKWVLEVRGVDVYDPTSGDVRSNSTKEIALWMMDTDYDGESFFVRHAYFLGDNDPFRSLKIALKADIDPDAWSTLYRAESIPFDTPSTGKIAVKVINDYGDEVMKVLEVP